MIWLGGTGVKNCIIPVQTNKETKNVRYKCHANLQLMLMLSNFARLSQNTCLGQQTSSSNTVYYSQIITNHVSVNYILSLLMISTSAQRELTIAVLVLCVITPKEDSTASVNKDMRETDKISQVMFCSVPFLFCLKRKLCVSLALKTAAVIFLCIQPRFRY